MTAVSEIIGEALIYIDDVRMQEQLSSNPALFYRRTSTYVTASMPLLSSPPELYCHVSKNFVAPTYADYTWESTWEATTQETVVQTGLTGYDICSVTARSEDGMYAIPYDGATYDPETGDVTFQKQPSEGIEYELDFYKDGATNDLTLHQKRLWALAIAVVWNERFNNDWLNIQPKIKDSSFQTVNEANFIDKLTDRMIANRQAFEDELHKYEQLNAYRNINVPFGMRKLI